MSKSVWHYLWLIIMGDIPQITVFCKSWNIRQWTIFPFKIRKQEEWRGQLKLHSIHIYVLKWKPEPWFPCLDAWLSSDWVPDWSMTHWWGAWLHSFPLYSASLLQGVIRRAGRAPRSVAYWSLSLSIYHDEAEWASAERQAPQSVIYTTASFYWDKFNSQFSFDL